MDIKKYKSIIIDLIFSIKNYLTHPIILIFKREGYIVIETF